MKSNDDKPLYELDDAPLYSLSDEHDDDAAHVHDPVVDEMYHVEDEIYEEEEEEEPEAAADEEVVEVKKKPSPLKIMLQTLIGPVEGWKALKRARFSTEEFASRCFYPLIALAAVSECSILFYEANMTMADWAKAGLATFVSFFFGYFTILFLGSFVLPSKSRDVLKKDIGKQFVMLALSTLAIFYSVIQILPMLEPILVFLPLWTIYLIVKGVRILRVPKESETPTIGLLCTLIIGVPILLYWVMTELLLPK